MKKSDDDENDRSGKIEICLSSSDSFIQHLPLWTCSDSMRGTAIIKNKDAKRKRAIKNSDTPIKLLLEINQNASVPGTDAQIARRVQNPTFLENIALIRVREP